MRRVELDLNIIQSAKELHGILKERMGFPEHYGENLDALHDMLTEISGNVCVELRLCSDTAAPLYEYTKKLERVMEDAAQTIEYTEDGRMFAVFANHEYLDLGSAW